MLVKNKASIFSQDKSLLAQGIKLNGNLVKMFILPEETIKANLASTAPLKVWHERLGHVNRNSIEKMINNNVVSGISLTDRKDFFCESCPLGKQHKACFQKKEINNDIAPGEIIYSDLCGPMQTPSIGNARFLYSLRTRQRDFAVFIF